jgi:hypothetical protein
MGRLAIAAVLVGLAAAVPAAGKGWPPATGATICGAGGCRDIGARLARQLDPAETYQPRVGPHAPAPFYRVEIRARGSSQLVYYLPSIEAIRTVGVWPPEWRKVGLRIDTRLAPYPKPRPTDARVDGRPVRDPASYLVLYWLRGRAKGVDPPARLIAAGDLRGVRRSWIPIELEAAYASPWTGPEAVLWLGRHRDVLVRAGRTMAIPHRLAEQIRHRRSLATVY